MKILFLHPNFPGQFLNLATAMAHSDEVVFLTANTTEQLAGVNKIVYGTHGKIAPMVHQYVKPVENAVRQGQAAYEAAARLKAQGFYPDVVLGHSGWGPTLFMKDLFPRAACISYFEWFNHARNSIYDFDQENHLPMDELCAIRVFNIPILTDLYSCDAGVTPTYWQKRHFPVEYHSKIKVLHDGIKTDVYCPRQGAKQKLGKLGLDIADGAEIITYVARGMEASRGFPQFMRALEKVLRCRPHCHAIIVGADRIAYGGPKPPNGLTYKEWMLKELDLDLKRIHFTGLLQRAHYRKILQASDVHVYLTYPFVLSWSALEAMSTGCLLVASDTGPVHEVIRHGENGLLVDFFSSDALAEQIVDALSRPEAMSVLRRQARQTILDDYSWEKLLPKWREFLEANIRQ